MQVAGSKPDGLLSGMREVEIILDVDMLTRYKPNLLRLPFLKPTKHCTTVFLLVTKLL